jgi:lipopolysaccharide export system ATP-binding protein
MNKLMSLLKAEKISKSYKLLEVIKEISFEISSGEVVGLLGPNGAGKTTAFYIIVGLVMADRGSVYLDDKNITELNMHQRANLGLGYLPQEASIFRKLTVEENILAILEYQTQMSHIERQQKLDQLLEELHIGHVKKSLGINLSGGERRRVEIARALAANPNFILLDEPFAGVDPISVIDIQRIITQLKNQNIGILITDHNVRETLGICERAYILNDGDLIASGSPEEILSDSNVREVYLGHDFKL